MDSLESTHSARDSRENRVKSPLGERDREKEPRHEGEDSESRREEACCQGSREEGACEEEEVASRFQPAATEPVMSRIAALAASVAAAVAFGAEAAAAVSLTNRDDREHKVTVVEGESSQDSPQRQ